MSKVILYIAVSVDGYIAEKNGSVNFLEGDDSSNVEIESYNKFIQSVDKVIMGYNTYQQITTQLSDVWPYEGKDCYVLTNRNIIDKSNIYFVNEDINDLISKLKLETSKNIWICGGASVASQVYNLDLIDEYIISYIPIILGNGISLYENFDITTKLNYINSSVSNGILEVTYSKKL